MYGNDDRDNGDDDDNASTFRTPHVKAPKLRPASPPKFQSSTAVAKGYAAEAVENSQYGDDEWEVAAAEAERRELEREAASKSRKGSRKPKSGGSSSGSSKLSSSTAIRESPEAIALQLPKIGSTNAASTSASASTTISRTSSKPNLKASRR